MTKYNENEESRPSAVQDFESDEKDSDLENEPSGLLFLKDRDAIACMLENILHESGIEMAEKIEIKSLSSYLNPTISFSLYAKDTDGRAYEIEIEKDEETKEAITAKIAFDLGAFTINYSVKDQDGQDEPTITSISITKPNLLNKEEFEEINEIDELFGSDNANQPEVVPSSEVSEILVHNLQKTPPTLRKLMHGFSSANPDEILLPLLEEKSKFSQKEKESAAETERLFGDFIREKEKDAEKRGAKKERKRLVRALLEKGTLSLEEISEVSGFSLKKLKKLKAKSA